MNTVGRVKLQICGFIFENECLGVRYGYHIHRIAFLLESSEIVGVGTEFIFTHWLQIIFLSGSWNAVVQ